MITKVGSKFIVKSESGAKILSRKLSRKAAVKRLHQIEYFKHQAAKQLRKGGS